MDTDDIAEETRTDLDAIRSRHHRATAGVIDMLASVNDIPPLLSEVERLCGLVLDSRLSYANLHAAARAALSAERDGEPNSFAYLVDELDGEWPVSADDRGRR